MRRGVEIGTGVIGRSLDRGAAGSTLGVQFTKIKFRMETFLIDVPMTSMGATVNERTVVTLLRLRHQLISTRAGKSTTLLVEECSSVAWRGAQSITLAADADALALLKPPPIGDPPQAVRERMVTQAIEQLSARRKEIDSWADARAQILLADHRRVREAADAKGKYTVKALLPVDIIGLFVLLPKVA